MKNVEKLLFAFDTLFEMKDSRCNHEIKMANINKGKHKFQKLLVIDYILKHPKATIKQVCKYLNNLDTLKQP